MKESEKEKQEQRELHEKRVERKKLLKRKREEEFRESFSERNIDLEKQLRRLATRGGIDYYKKIMTVSSIFNVLICSCCLVQRSRES